MREHSLNDERLRALCILTYSDNTELQRSAALCFAELSESSMSFKLDSYKLILATKGPTSIELRE